MINVLIKESNQGNRVSTEKLLEKFKPLIKKYSFLLHYEDAESELQLFLLELFRKIPSELLEEGNNGKLINYISISINNHYKHLLSTIIKNKNYLPISALSENQKIMVLSALSHEFNHDIEIIQTLQSALTKNEYDVIILRYFFQYSIQEIAFIKSSSRQSVNQTHNRAIKKIKKLWEIHKPPLQKG